MYCQKCGTQNPDNVNFCQNCGNSLKFSEPSEYREKIKTKQEYLREYHSNHSEYYALCALSVIFYLIGAIVIIVKIVDIDVFSGYISSSQQGELARSLIIGIVLFVLGTVFSIAAIGIDKTAVKEYESYISGLASKQVRFDSAPITSDSWICSVCGIRNSNIRVSCSNCGTEKKATDTHRSAYVNEWVCPKCGKINQNYVGTCGCGEVKPK